MKRVIVIGLDGFETKIVDRLLAAGALPSLAGLAGRGGYASLRTTYPAQTPVAWSTFATGTNPGGHGIFDFVCRDPRTYLPDFSLTRYEQKSPYLPPRVVNLRGGTPVWTLLSAAGLPSVVLRCPCTYPPDEIRGRVLSGMGVPDIRGGLGTPTLYTSNDGVQLKESEHVVRVQPNPDGTIRTHLIGPRNPRAGADFRVNITLHPDPPAGRVRIIPDGQPAFVEVCAGQWSDWLKIRFKTGVLQSASGIVRFYLVRQQPVFELYASPVNFDPRSPLFPISAPPDYARELADRLGTFYTTGMVEDHGGLNNGRLDERAFLQQCSGVLRERERMLFYELERLEEGLLFCLFDTPDRVQHMFWRFLRRDGSVPMAADAELSRVIDDHYRACDAIVGNVVEAADDRTLVVVLSDHGMGTFARGMHLNTWLHDQGLLTLEDGVKPGEEAGDLLRRVDWSRTQAYALGLGTIYLNLRGREDQGIVDERDAETLKSRIARGLTGVVDPAEGEMAVRSVLSRESVYTGPYAPEAPDLIVNFADGYRVSWSTALGGVPAGHFEDNQRKWSGDHLMDPALVPGVLFMNRPFRGDGPGLIDLAPTILAALGLPKGPAMEGASLLI